MFMCDSVGNARRKKMCAVWLHVYTHLYLSVISKLFSILDALPEHATPKCKTFHHRGQSPQASHINHRKKRHPQHLITS